MPTYSINELANLADVTPRTIRYYIEQGLLPSPGQLGPSTQYTDEHLERLRLIKKLQASYLPLAEIRNRLRNLSPDELAEIAESAPAAEPRAAIDYIRDVLGEAEQPPSATPARGLWKLNPGYRGPMRGSPEYFLIYESKRSQWERISLDPDVELHVRRPLTRHNTKRVERLIRVARELFEED